MGAIVEFIKNNKQFKEIRNLDYEELTDAKLKKILRKAFRYAQDKIKDQFE